MMMSLSYSKSVIICYTLLYFKTKFFHLTMRVTTFASTVDPDSPFSKGYACNLFSHEASKYLLENTWMREEAFLVITVWLGEVMDVIHCPWFWVSATQNPITVTVPTTKYSSTCAQSPHDDNVSRQIPVTYFFQFLLYTFPSPLLRMPFSAFSQMFKSVHPLRPIENVTFLSSPQNSLTCT